MKWAVLAARLLVGLVFLVFGANYFLKFMDLPPPPPDSAVGAYVGVMEPSGYLTVVKVLEVVGGLLLVFGVFVPVGITILTPIIVNILLFEVLIAKQPGIGVALTGLAAFLIAGYWNHFKAVFDPRAKPGGCC